MPYSKENYHLQLAASRRYRKSEKGRAAAKRADEIKRNKLREFRKKVRAEANRLREADRRQDPWFGVDYT